jgi:DNA polymerase I-like protein with 3'-5' exonuclease and polymerase domains
LFTVPKGWKLFGTDAAGLELRMLAHYMAPFDGGAYADIILNGDIHTTNQEAAGLESRDMAKTFIYAKIYGSGIDGLAETCKTTTKEMRKIVKSFNENTPALKQLTDAVKEASAFRGYVKSLDGRRIPVKSQHSALNYLLQSSGAIVCKYWMVEFHRLVKKAGYVSGVDYKQSAFVHDELQWAFNPKTIDGELLGKLSREAMVSTGKKLGVRIPLDIGYDIGDTYADTH